MKTLSEILKNFDIPEEQKASLIYEIKDWAIELVFDGISNHIKASKAEGTEASDEIDQLRQVIEEASK